MAAPFTSSGNRSFYQKYRRKYSFVYSIRLFYTLDMEES